MMRLFFQILSRRQREMKIASVDTTNWRLNRFIAHVTTLLGWQPDKTGKKLIPCPERVAPAVLCPERRVIKCSFDIQAFSTYLKQ